MRDCSAPQLVLLSELHERARVRELLENLAVIGAGTAGGDAAQRLWRHLEGRLQESSGTVAGPLQPKCQTPLSAAEFERMLKPDAE